MYIQASWTFDLDSQKSRFLIRCVKYWKGRKYVYFIDEYKRIADKLSADLLKQIDEQIIEDIVAHIKGKNND